MISNSIVILSLVFAAAYCITWLLRRDVREKIEQPKYQFQQRVEQYDRQRRNPEVDAEKIHARNK